MDVNLVKKFAKFCQKKLGIKKLPKIRLTQSRDEVKTTGGYKRGIEIIIYTKGRHLVDICRSLGHELKHHKQLEDGEFGLHDKIQDVGGKYEDEANATAGQLIKQFAYAGNMNIYESKQRLTEGRVEDAKRQFPTIHPKLIDYISSKDPSGNNKYLKWIIKQLRKATLLNPDLAPGRFVDELLTTLRQYEELQPYYSAKALHAPSLTPKIIAKPKDINSYDSIEEVMLANKMIDAIRDEKQMEKDQLRAADIVHDGEDYQIVHIQTPAQACYFGANTRWCPAGETSHRQTYDYLKHSNIFFIINKSEQDAGPYSKVILTIPKEMIDQGGYSFYLNNDRPVSFDDIREHDEKLGQMVRVVEMWRESGNLRTAESIKTAHPKLYVLTQYLGDDSLNHYKFNDAIPMVDYTYNNGKIKQTYLIGNETDVKRTAKVIYQNQFKEHPKLLFRHPEELHRCIEIKPLLDKVLNYIGFNGLYADAITLQSNIKDYYPIPPMKLKTEKIDNNKFDLAKLNDIDETITKNNVDIKMFQRSLKHLIQQNTVTEKFIKDLSDKVDVLKTRAEQVKGDSKLHNDIQAKISENLFAITHQTDNLKQDYLHQHQIENHIKVLQKETNQLSDLYTNLINTVESNYQDKSNYEYSADQIKAAKNKIQIDVAANPIKWVQKLKLKPEELITMVNVKGLADIMSDKLAAKVKSFGDYKLIKKIIHDKKSYYIFTYNETK